jgi:hypothetical protein
LNEVSLWETKLVSLDSAFSFPLCQVLMGSKKQKSEMQRKLHFALAEESGDFLSPCNVTIAGDARGLHGRECVSGMRLIETNYKRIAARTA